MEADKLIIDVEGHPCEVVRGPGGEACINAEQVLAIVGWKVFAEMLTDDEGVKLLNAADAIKSGKSTLAEYLSTDQGLDAINEYKKKTGKSVFETMFYSIKKQ